MIGACDPDAILRAVVQLHRPSLLLRYNGHVLNDILHVEPTVALLDGVVVIREWLDKDDRTPWQPAAEVTNMIIAVVCAELYNYLLLVWR